MQMGTLEEMTDRELEGEVLVGSSSPAARKTQTFETSHCMPIADVAHAWTPRQIRSRFLMNIYIVLIRAKINVLLPFGPLAVLVHHVSGKHLLDTYIAGTGMGLLPQLARHNTFSRAFGFCNRAACILHWTNRCICSLSYTILDTLPSHLVVGGLLNATFGNATEMIISLYALKQGMIHVVKQSLLGSILSNMLLVLGCAFFIGGICNHKKDQVFNKATAVVNSGLLLMAVMGIMFPAVLHFTHTELHAGTSELALSRFSSCVMLIAYAAYLFFQLKSHHNLYDPIIEEGDHKDENSDEDEVPEITQWESIAWLAVLTVWVSIVSGYLVDAIQGASDSWNMPVAFISVILLPIVGNAAEHASAIMFATKNKLDITLGVAIGSSTQISMFVIPFCVVVGWAMGTQMDLNFQLFETATLFITVLVVAFMLQEGTANYFKGLMLILCYLIVAASFYVHVVDPPSRKSSQASMVMIKAQQIRVGAAKRYLRLCMMRLQDVTAGMLLGNGVQ
ncbi:Vacuolar cation/proton exchanger 2 [Asimina triloba]